MTISVTVEPVTADRPDERLRILWIEDKVKVVPEIGPATPWGDTLQIVTVKSPSAAWALLRKPECTDLLRTGFDIYICDFKLHDLTAKDVAAANKLQEATANETDNAKIGFPTAEEQIRDDPSDVELGQLAPSAGLLIGLLTAFHFPDRPSVVAPYSAYPGEFGQVWRLVRAFAPVTARLLRSTQVEKQAQAQVPLLKRTAKEFRSTIFEWIRSDKLTLRSDELELFMNTPTDEMIPPTTLLTLVSPSSIRRIRIGALFADSDRLTYEGVPAVVVRDFIESLPPANQEFKRAVALAKSFIGCAEQELSVQLYDAVYMAKDQGRTPVIQYPPEFRPWLGSREMVEHYTDKERCDAFLIILVYIYGHYLIPLEIVEKSADSEDDEDNITVSEFTARVAKKYNITDFPILSNGLFLLIQEIGLTGDASLSEFLDEHDRPLTNAATDRRNMFERLIQRYVDPGPRSTEDILPNLEPEARIGKGLARLLEGKDGTKDAKPPRRRLQGILNNRNSLGADRLRVALAYAKENLPPRSTGLWPLWLDPLERPEPETLAEHGNTMANREQRGS